MQKQFRKSILPALLAIAAPGAFAAEGTVTGIELVKCGTYTNKVVGKEVDKTSASGTHSAVGELDLLQETKQIPARAGVGFGCRVLLKGNPDGAEASFTGVMRMPSDAKDAKGQPFPPMRAARNYTIGGAKGGYVGYTFRDQQRMAPGTWVLEAWVGDRKLAETTFEVVK